MSIYLGAIKINKVGSSAIINRIYVGGATAFGGAGGSATPADPVAPTFINPPSPSLSGSTVGIELTINNVQSQGTAPITTSYIWTQNGSVIGDATSQSYTPSATGSLLGNVTITNSVGSTSATADFGDIATNQFAAEFLGTPTRSAFGVTVGTTVTINNVGATGIPEPSTTYRWTQNGSVIGDATSQSYATTATGDLLGNVTIFNGIGASAGVTVDFGNVVAAAAGNFAPFFTGTPSGSTTNPDVGERMTFLDYGSTGQPGPTTSFQWYDDGAAISGATGYGYVLGATGELADASKTVIVTIPSGIGGGFFFDGVQKPGDYPLTRGVEYIFDQSDTSNNGHPLVLKNGGVNYSWTTDTNPGGGFSNGIGVRTLIVPADAPASLTYVCGVHGAGMGNSIAVTTVPAVDVTMTGNLTGVVSLTNSEGTTGATIDFGTMINADIESLSLSNVVVGATLTATVTYGGTAPNIAWSGVTS